MTCNQVRAMWGTFRRDGFSKRQVRMWLEEIRTRPGERVPCRISRKVLRRRKQLNIRRFRRRLREQLAKDPNWLRDLWEGDFITINGDDASTVEIGGTESRE